MKNDSTLNKMADKKPIRLNEVFDEAAMQAVCPKSGEESLLCIITKKKGGAL